MSDREGFGGGDDEHTLPKATVYKLISGASSLPPSLHVSPSPPSAPFAFEGAGGRATSFALLEGS